jgi:murein L,D-transpeptidase YafK
LTAGLLLASFALALSYHSGDRDTARELDDKLRGAHFSPGSPIMIRIFKRESELELWMLKDERFQLFATYPICYWSGQLGPKEREGDHQAPEGFYSVELNQLHVSGRHPRSFDIGFPNAFDRTLGRTGSFILVHGGCRSVGCFAMTDPVMEEIYMLVERALQGDQERIQVQVFPFRMTDANLAPFANSKWYNFWLNLKEGYDAFEQTRMPPSISSCQHKYVVDDASSAVSVACASPETTALTSPKTIRHLGKRRLAASRHRRHGNAHGPRTSASRVHDRNRHSQSGALELRAVPG